MKPFIKIILLLLLPCSGITQDTTITISPGMLKKDYIPLGNIDGWLFRQGHDTAWAKKDINSTDWEKLKPTALSEKLADKHGRLEGWLRIKIKLDSAFGDTALELDMDGWAASEVYVDGNLLNTFGNTGANGKPFKEFNPFYKLPVAFNIEKGKEHIIAVHIVDFLSPFPPYHLKSEEGFHDFISITTPEFRTASYDLYRSIQFYTTIWLLVSVILSLLFWLLAFQNRVEKNLLFIALSTTGFALIIYCETYFSPDSPYFVYRLRVLALPILRSVTLILMIVLMLRIFKRKITLLFKIIAGILFIGGITRWFLQTPIIIFQASSILLIYAYYIITSWKTLRGAQWAIVAGVILAVSFGLLLATSTLVNPEINYSLGLLYASGLFLSFPLSLLVYVAMRFREIIKEVQQNAKQVMQLSEEKKEQAINQQKVLQEEVNRQTAEIRATLDNLKSTQSQLIQSEKMASLGELTAGIAHEIQNPLNFVNNFSEMNTELIEELEGERSKVKGERNEEFEKELLDDVKQNTDKILHHGKRADAIVKGMLQHSRASSGQKELTDINALADEYLRLAYHGLRAKDKSFNAKFETDLDKTIEKINVVPQDIGRVILNLINNAFYAVTEKKQQLDGSYEPCVSISTRKADGRVEVKVKDNGNGISPKVKDKIFQPFFTTKPTGQGTGLGLSLSYDIAKAHGGELKVETKEGEGSEFIIQLPTV